MAWATRNLLELAVLLDVGLKSKEYREWLLDLSISDLKNFVDVVASYTADLDDPHPGYDEFKCKVEATFETFSSEHPIERHRTTGEIAKKADKERQEFFSSWNKLLSKWAHPTPFSLFHPQPPPGHPAHHGVPKLAISICQLMENDLGVIGLIEIDEEPD